MTTKPRPPAGLGTRGAAFWKATVAEFELDPADCQVLREICHLLDELDRLHASLKRDGVTVTGSKGQVRSNPVLGELRQGRMALARLLKALELPPEDEVQRPAPAVRAKAQKAANARWHPHTVARGEV